MGSLFYGDTPNPIEIDDLALAHLKVVIAAKLRRRESFTISWRHPSGGAGDHSTVWLQPSIPLRFVFHESVAPALDRAQIQALARAANTMGGIHLVPDDRTGALTLPVDQG